MVVVGGPMREKAIEILNLLKMLNAEDIKKLENELKKERLLEK